MIEGSRRRHCVGGYARSVKTGYSKIISFENKLNRDLSFTMELTSPYTHTLGRKYCHPFEPTKELKKIGAWEGKEIEEHDFIFGANKGDDVAKFFVNTQSRGFYNCDVPHADLTMAKLILLENANINVMSKEEYSALCKINENVDQDLESLI